MEPTDLKDQDHALWKNLTAPRHKKPMPKVVLHLECTDAGIAHHLLVLYTTLTLYAEYLDGDRMPIEMAEALPDTLHVLRDAVLDLVEVEDGGKKGYIGSTEFEDAPWNILRRFLEFPGDWGPASSEDTDLPD
jgi:hypothetical protein